MSFIHISQPRPALPDYLFPGFQTHGSVIRLLVIRATNQKRVSTYRQGHHHGPDLVDGLGLASIMTAHSIDDYSLLLP